MRPIPILMLRMVVVFSSDTCILTPTHLEEREREVEREGAERREGEGGRAGAGWEERLLVNNR